jgi:hypothetical protein
MPHDTYICREDARAPHADPDRLFGLTTPAKLRALPKAVTLATLAFVGAEDQAEYVVFQEHHRGAVRRSYAVDLVDLAGALSANLPLSSGVLPGDEAGPNVLFWATANGWEKVGVWVGPRVWRLTLLDGPGATRRLRLPFPGLLFVVDWHTLDAEADAHKALHRKLDVAPYVFAAPRRPTSSKEPLFRAPAYNVFASGRVCTGSHVFPRDPLRVPGEFFASHFRATGDTCTQRSKRHPEDIGHLWRELHGQDAYPLDDLVPQLHLADAFNLAGH